jgi:hypothetical protein
VWCGSGTASLFGPHLHMLLSADCRVKKVTHRHRRRRAPAHGTLALLSCPAEARSEQRDLLLRSAGISPRTKNSSSSRGLLPRQHRRLNSASSGSISIARTTRSSVGRATSARRTRGPRPPRTTQPRTAGLPFRSFLLSLPFPHSIVLSCCI